MKRMKGTILALKTPNTAQVSVARLWQHPLYGKAVKRTKSYACHYTTEKLSVGDEVIIEECRPMSKTKRFRVVEKVEVGA